MELFLTLKPCIYYLNYGNRTVFTFSSGWINFFYLYYAELFEIELFICIKMDLVLNNLQWLMCHETKRNDTNA